jgi:peptidoglycan/xylan/chitin deacetylase (PgdA/CDA1 family)
LASLWKGGSLRLIAIGILLAASLGGAQATECGSDKLGTSRVMGVGTQGGLEVGEKTYPRTLALADHEVVLTFDDGPAAGTTAKILDALAHECVRATFFLIGRNAEALRQLARREEREGHTIAHHSYSHPASTLRYISDAAARADIIRGMAAVEKAVYGSGVDASAGAAAAPRPRTPFFRFPGFADTADLNRWLGAGNIGVFGADLWASDWIQMNPGEELALTLARLERTGRGIVLFHDTHRWTAEMLPEFLRELKLRGYRVVHIVPAWGSAQTVSAAPGWSSETERVIVRLKPRLSRPAVPAL